MMTREQREQAYAAIGILKNRGWTEHADAVSQALADLHEYEVSPSSFSVLRDEAYELMSQDVKAPSAEETYTYWVVYAYREMSGGAQVLGSCRHERSTPILTCEDRYFVSQKIASDMGCSVTMISTELMVNEEGR